MTDEGFDNFINDCYDALENKQNLLMEKYQLDKFEEYWYDQHTETIQFKNEGVVGLEFSIIPIGSWSSNTNTWMWSWANQSTTEPLRAKSAKLKELAETTGYRQFENEHFEAKEIMAYELTAMAVHHLNAMGMYVAPSGHLKVFLALMEVKE